MRLLGVLVLVLVVAACGGGQEKSTAGASPSSAASSSSPSATPSATSLETATCIQRVGPWLDEVQTLDTEVNGDGVNSLTLQDHVDSLGAAYNSFEGVCSPQLRQAAADADYRFSLANLSLRVCVVNAAKCDEYQAKAQRALTRGLADFPKVNDLVNP